MQTVSFISDVFESVGGFDEAFVNGGEDVDLCQKVKAKGLHIYMAYRSVVHHHVSLSRDRTSLQNEVNSRLLQQKWRPQLKREAARVWQQGLPEALDGLQPSFLATPFAAAQIMSESALLREEARWARLLDQSDPNAALAERCRSSGLQRLAAQCRRLIFQAHPPCAAGADRPPKGLKRLLLAGQQTSPPIGVQTQVTITVNGVQSITFTLGAQRHFNLGLSHPVVLAGVTNLIEVVFRSQCPVASTDNWVPTDPCTFITLAHLVMDEKVITQLAGAQ